MARILIVDDEVAVAILLADLLNQAGYETARAYGGRDAVRIFREFQPELVVTDLIMHDMDGILLIQNLRRTNSTVPILALSGKSPNQGEGYLQQALAAGADLAMQKPFVNEEILDAVKKLLSPPA